MTDLASLPVDAIRIIVDHLMVDNLATLRQVAPLTHRVVQIPIECLLAWQPPKLCSWAHLEKILIMVAEAGVGEDSTVQTWYV